MTSRISAFDLAVHKKYVLDEMAWDRPKHSQREVNTAGSILIDPKTDPFAFTEALGIVNNWRASHYFPLNTFQMGLRGKAQRVYHKSLVAQRIKRLRSIREKLERISRLSLAELQDIGGCRAVVDSVKSVKGIVNQYVDSWHKHKLLKTDDYIGKPNKNTGYRSYHLVYGYRSDVNQEYNGMRIEIQIRSHLQHLWATSVEIIDGLHSAGTQIESWG